MLLVVSAILLCFLIFLDPIISGKVDGKRLGF